MPAGIQDISIISVLSECTMANANNDITTPVPNNIRSNGLNILNINVPLLALAGTKYPFTLYHTPFLFYCPP